MKIMEIYTMPYLSECLTVQGTYKAMQNNNGNVANRTKCYSVRLEEKREQMITFILRWGGGRMEVWGEGGEGLGGWGRGAGWEKACHTRNVHAKQAHIFAGSFSNMCPHTCMHMHTCVCMPRFKNVLLTCMQSFL